MVFLLGYNSGGDLIATEAQGENVGEAKNTALGFFICYWFHFVFYLLVHCWLLIGVREVGGLSWRSSG